MSQKMRATLNTLAVFGMKEAKVMSTNTFNDDEYIQKVFRDNIIDKSTFSLMKKASELSYDVRKFEIELFWKRGTYYWAFILASFTAYKLVDFNKLSFSYLVGFPFLSKFVMLIISFLCFFFCLSWVLVNKQKNWESHIDALEERFSGKLYQTFLNTKHSDFKKCPLSKQAYDYSVTKITTIGSIVLICVSAFLCLFHVVLFWGKLRDIVLTLDIDSVSFLAGIAIIILMCIATWRLMQCAGNVDENKKQAEGAWRQRSK